MRPLDIVTQTERRLDTMSETSEGTTTTGTSISGKSSIDNAEELRDLAAALGIANPDDVEQERFRVDRRKLEQMLLDDDTSESGELAYNQAEDYFRKLMDETNTVISWPSRLKVGAKSKKDPHVKVSGLRRNVRLAKDRIMQKLDTRQNNRVTMKLDVSYTDHSHIIGKGGLTIRRVMEDTSCHIHFPDSNRSNHQEKSNQVSIAGDMVGVERARARVRMLTPLIFSFELPVMGSNPTTAPFTNSPYIAKIEEQYNVQVMFRTRPKLHATLVVVKGCEWEVGKVKEATVLLIHNMCENLASQIQIQMSMEISPQHHNTVLGPKSNNLRQIMHRTGTQIMFPDAGDPNIPSLKKSNVTITGTIHSVYLARQQLMGSLPLVLMFDLPEKFSSIMNDIVERLTSSLDVYINIRHKPKQSALSIVVKGIERNATNIYEARRRLLSLEEPKVIADIPASYLIPRPLGPFIVNDNYSNAGLNSTAAPPSQPYCGLSPPSSSNSLNNTGPWGVPAQMQTSLYSPVALQPQQFTSTYAYPPPLLTTQQQEQQQQQQQQQQQILQNANQHMGLGAQLHSTNTTGFNAVANGTYSGAMKNGLFALDSSKDSSAFSSMSSVSSSLSSPALSPRNVSPIDPSAPFKHYNSNLDSSNVLSDMTHANNNSRAPGIERKTTHSNLASNHEDISTLASDYESRKLMAVKALLSKPNPNEYRVPTDIWSKSGLSQSEPSIGTVNTSSVWKTSPTSTQDFGVTSTKDESSNNPISGVTSSYLDHTSSSQIKKITTVTHEELPMLLASINMEKYIDLFKKHEVDLTTFSTLNDSDLCHLGVTAWGARRKMMLVISELKKRTSSFSGSAAPGAERKLASSGTPPTPARKNSLETNAW